ncbi:MAG TPA: hypothetical protein ACHBX0_02660 [Arsenophonus sp.]
MGNMTPSELLVLPLNQLGEYIDDDLSLDFSSSFLITKPCVKSFIIQDWSLMI